jgi:hypothetical protein
MNHALFNKVSLLFLPQSHEGNGSLGCFKAQRDLSLHFRLPRYNFAHVILSDQPLADCIEVWLGKITRSDGKSWDFSARTCLP